MLQKQRGKTSHQELSSTDYSVIYRSYLELKSKITFKKTEFLNKTILFYGSCHHLQVTEFEGQSVYFRTSAIDAFLYDLHEWNSTVHQFSFLLDILQ